MDIDARIERYGNASRQDDGALAALFTEEALYASLPLKPPHHDREGMSAYRRRATADQEGAARCSTWRGPEETLCAFAKGTIVPFEGRLSRATR